MHLRIYSAFVSVFAALAITLPSPCHAAIGETSVPLRATPKTQSWVSHRTFEPDDVVIVGITVNGKELHNANLGCDIYYAGRGVAVRVNLCGRSAVPLRAHYASLSARTIAFRLSYRVE